MYFEEDIAVTVTTHKNNYSLNNNMSYLWRDLADSHHPTESHTMLQTDLGHLAQNQH